MLILSLESGQMKSSESRRSLPAMCAQLARREAVLATFPHDVVARTRAAGVALFNGRVSASPKELLLIHVVLTMPTAVQKLQVRIHDVAEAFGFTGQDYHRHAKKVGDIHSLPPPEELDQLGKILLRTHALASTELKRVAARAPPARSHPAEVAVAASPLTPSALLRASPPPLPPAPPPFVAAALPSPPPAAVALAVAPASSPLLPSPHLREGEGSPPLPPRRAACRRR